MASVATSPATGGSARLAAIAGFHELRVQTGARLTGPGGLYNAGNAIGLAMGVALQVGSAPASGLGVESALAACLEYLAGNAAAMALTAATAVFFWSGEAYHRAWAHGFPPIQALNRRGDLLSGIGALVLGVALLSLGHVLLAATAGLLHAIGKFGSAYRWRPMPGWRRTWPDFYRSAVLASRVPAVLVTLGGLAEVVDRSDAGTPWGAYLTPLTLLVCYALWAWADLLLFNAKPAAAATPTVVAHAAG
jgi:hypothetical protein